MKIEYIPLLEDNYCYLIINNKQGLLVDPAGSILFKFINFNFYFCI